MKKHFKAVICVLFAAIIGLGFVPCVIAYAGNFNSQTTTLNGKDPVHDFLSTNAVLSYMYSYRDDYYYVNSPAAWQRNFGYTRVYDLVAPYLLMEYDYTRVHFTYEGKDWMIQIWKGQYGLAFYGAEVGIYTKEHSDAEDSYLTKYNCASDEDSLMMQTEIYHDQKGNGEYVREFTTPYEKTWWSTGFKMGHLLIQEPAVELRMQGIITMKDEEMTRLFAQGLEECGFKWLNKPEEADTPEETEIPSGEEQTAEPAESTPEEQPAEAPAAEELPELENDSFYVDGLDVHYRWQNNSEAENTMPIKMATGTLLFLNFSSIIAALLLFTLSLMGMGFVALIIL